MSLQGLVGTEAEPVTIEWSQVDTILYALGVGAGQNPALDELHLTVESSSAGPLVALPGLAAALCLRAPSLVRTLPLGDHPVVHAAQRVITTTPLPTVGGAVLHSRITAVHDAGRGAVLVTTTTATDPDLGTELFTTESQAYVIGAGGFGGEPPPARPRARPSEAAPDVRIDLATRPEQALLYRLTGDRNPMHVDPEAAARAGFERPILHGLATLGAAVRLLVHATCGGDPSVVRALHGRFTGTVEPGDLLRVEAWRREDGVDFDVVGVSGRPVVKDGSLTFA